MFAEAEVLDLPAESVQQLYRPVLYERVPEIPKLNADDTDYQWWKRQLHRCLYGWIAPNGHYLNGYLYFYLNFCIIPLRKEGEERFDWEPPMYRDNDEEILDIIWANTYRRLPNGKSYNARNHIEAKPRGIAWTTFTLLGVALWTFIFRNDLQIGCAYPNEEAIDTEREWFRTAWQSLHPMFKRWNGKDLVVLENNRSAFSVGYSQGKIKRIVNKCRFDIIGQETKAGVYKGKRMNLMIAVEAGLWVGDSLKNYLTENEPSAKLGDDQWGMFLVGGTSNAIINKSTAYRDMFVGHLAYNATRHFTPKTKVLRGCIDYTTGKSDQEGALIKILAHRQSKVADPAAYQQEVIENPLTWEEAFLPNNKTSAYNTAAINEQITFIKLNHAQDNWVRGRLEYLMDRYNRPTDNIVFEESPGGDWCINLEGKPSKIYENLHIAGIDDRYKSRGEGHKVSAGDSKNAMVIYRKPTAYDIKSDMPVAVYYGNAPDMVVAYEEFYKGMLFYNVSKTLYEYNSEGFILFMREKKALDRLFYVGDQPGIKIKNAHVKAELTYLGTQFFTEGRHKNITLPLILEELMKWGTYENTDIASAFHLVLKLLELTQQSNVTKLDQSYQNESSIIQLGPNRSSADGLVAGYPIIRLGPVYA
ncbi:hypothetical protein [Dyadobacter sp. BHUBP1]|uniref:hypothetical protein n=1 Tax=Dyadobacter sp. BHUBP1 TaxID=3424178 RepID=UPI003D32BD30